MRRQSRHQPTLRLSRLLLLIATSLLMLLASAPGRVTLPLPMRVLAADCAVGSFIRTEDGACVPCTAPAGRYCPLNGSDPQGLACPSEHSCVGGSAAPVPVDDVAVCDAPAGSHCPQGTTSEQLCPPGHWCAGGQAAPAPCTAAANHYCPAGSRNPLGVECPAGFRCAGGSYAPMELPPPPAPECEAPAGSFCQDGETNVRQCPAGSWCAGGKSAPEPCTAPSGRYCPAGSTAASGAPCPAGFTCGGDQAAPVAVVCAAAPGSFCASSSAPVASLCPAGQFCTGGAAQPQPCAAPSGRYCPLGSRVTNGDPCPAGHTCSGGQAAPVAVVCPAAHGSFCASEGSTATSTCPAGQFCAGGGAQPRPCMAPPGSHCPEGSSQAVGVACPSGGFTCAGGTAAPVKIVPVCAATAGSFCASGSTVAQSCPAGSWCAGGASAPQPCAAASGRYCPSGSLTSIGVPCPTGFSCSGGDALPVAIVCSAPAGSFCASPDAPAPSTCTAGHWCAGGNSQPQACTVPAGAHCPAGGSLPNGAPCPEGYSCSGGTAAPAALVPCNAPAGSFCSAPHSASPSPCPAGRWCVGGPAQPQECTAAEGSYCPPGSSGAGGVPCPSGFACSGGSAAPVNACIAPEGSFCAAPHANATLCPATFFCLGGLAQPIACPAGSTSAAGQVQCECAPGSRSGGGFATLFAGCTQCPAGSYSSEPQAKACLPCKAAPGHFCPAGSTSSEGQPCPPDAVCLGGIFPPQGGTKQCTARPGEFCPAGTRDPVILKCEANSWCRGGITQPVACGAGSVSLAGSDAASDCLCAAGFFSPDGHGPCARCPAHAYCAGGPARPVTCSAGYASGSEGSTPCARVEGVGYAPAQVDVQLQYSSASAPAKLDADVCAAVTSAFSFPSPAVPGQELRCAHSFVRTDGSSPSSTGARRLLALVGPGAREVALMRVTFVPTSPSDPGAAYVAEAFAAQLSCADGSGATGAQKECAAAAAASFGVGSVYDAPSYSLLAASIVPSSTRVSNGRMPLGSFDASSSSSSSSSSTRDTTLGVSIGVTLLVVCVGVAVLLLHRRRQERSEKDVEGWEKGRVVAWGANTASTAGGPCLSDVAGGASKHMHAPLPRAGKDVPACASLPAVPPRPTNSTTTSTASSGRGTQTPSFLPHVQVPSRGRSAPSSSGSLCSALPRAPSRASLTGSSLVRTPATSSAASDGEVSDVERQPQWQKIAWTRY